MGEIGHLLYMLCIMLLHCHLVCKLQVLHLRGSLTLLGFCLYLQTCFSCFATKASFVDEWSSWISSIWGNATEFLLAMILFLFSGIPLPFGHWGFYSPWSGSCEEVHNDCHVSFSIVLHPFCACIFNNVLCGVVLNHPHHISCYCAPQISCHLTSRWELVHSVADFCSVTVENFDCQFSNC